MVSGSRARAGIASTGCRPMGAVSRTHFPFRMRYVHRYEMELLLRAAGYRLEAVYGSYELEPFDSDSEKMIFVARVD